MAPLRFSKKWWAIWVFLFCSELLLFSWGYQKPPNHPPVWWFLRHPIEAVEYILLFFGGPFSHGTNLSSIAVGLSIGGLLLVMLLIAARAFNADENRAYPLPGDACLLR